MIEQLKTIREFFKLPVPHSPQDLGEYIAEKNKAVQAAAQLEAMVGEQEPVAFVNGAALSRLKNGESVPAYNCWGSPWPTPLYAAPVAQQPQAEAVPETTSEVKVKQVEALLDAFIERDPDRAARFIESQLAQIAVRKRLKAKQAEAVPTFDEQLREVAKRAAPQQAEAVPSDVVRDAERYRWLAARPNEWRLFRKHGKHKLPFRMMRDGDPWGQSFASADEAIDAAIAAMKQGGGV